MVLTRQAIEGQRFVDILFDPAGEFGVFGRPFGEPGRKIAARLGEVTPGGLVIAPILAGARFALFSIRCRLCRFDKYPRSILCSSKPRLAI